MSLRSEINSSTALSESVYHQTVNQSNTTAFHHSLNQALSKQKDNLQKLSEAGFQLDPGPVLRDNAIYQQTEQQKNAHLQRAEQKRARKRQKRLLSVLMS